jgi:benzoyl-CoA reductase/2-hydroxyglutaryl-CoA dehydratase subunit BcrC/BadD/HgdB
MAAAARRTGIRPDFLLRSAWAYRAARAALPLLEMRGAKPYQVAAIRCMLSDLAAAYLGERPCVFASAFVPTELIYGLGGVPFLPEAAAGLAAAFGLADRSLSAGEAHWYSPDLCSFHRAGLGGFAAGLLPRPSAVVAASHLCDGGKRSLFHMSRLVGCPFYVLDVPYGHSEFGARYLASQIERVAEDLVRRVPGLSLAGLGRALECSRKTLEEYRRVSALRRNVPAPWRGSEALNYVLLFLWSWGSPILTEFYSALRLHLERTVGSGAFPVREERHRLLWLNLRPYYATRMFSCIEGEWASSVAFEEYSFAYWPSPDPRDPFASLAEKMLSNFGWGPIERRLEVIERLVEEYSIDGVVQFAQWGCRQSNGGAAMIARRLAEKGIPFLNLDGDGVDARCGTEAQAITRLSAFMELLDARKGR